MPFLSTLPDDAVLLNVFKTFPDTAIPLLQYHEALMRGPSPFTVAERELIATYVSGLNACNYCAGVHEQAAKQFGIDEGLLADLLADIDGADVSAHGAKDNIKPVLKYVGKLTQTPSRMTQDDADQVFFAGWDEKALHDAVAVCALFNFMNRLVEGLGISAGADYFAMAGERLKKGGYDGLVRLMKEETGAA